MSPFARLVALCALVCGLAAPDLALATAKHLRPVPAATQALMRTKGMSSGAPILMRIFKKESELEIWKKTAEGRYALLKTYPICRWSGQLGPKKQVGDRQAPEGFYAVTPGLMNPNSSYYLSFDTGYPNAYDRSQGYTGSALMVHGACSSMGCFAMTDEAIGEIYALARDAFSAGQKAFQVQAFPFRMTAENMIRHRLDPNLAFWRQIKEGADIFEATREEPVVSMGGGRYAFRLKDPADAPQLAAFKAQEEDQTRVALEEGRPAVRTTYEDGGQHPTFMALARRGLLPMEISRPEALAAAGREVILVAAKPTRVAAAPKTAPPPVAAPAPQPAVQVAMVAARPLSSFFEPKALPETPGMLFAAAPLGGDSRASAPLVAGALPILGQQIMPRRVDLAGL